METGRSRERKPKVTQSSDCKTSLSQLLIQRIYLNLATAQDSPDATGEVSRATDPEAHESKKPNPRVSLTAHMFQIVTALMKCCLLQVSKMWLSTLCVGDFSRAADGAFTV